MRGITALDGIVTEVTDDQIMDAKALVTQQDWCRASQLRYCSGIRRLVEEGVISPQQRVVGMLTGNLLKDPI